MRKSTSTEIEHIPGLKQPELDRDDASRLGIELMLHVGKFYSGKILEIALRRIGYIKEKPNGRNTNSKDSKLVAGKDRTSKANKS